MGESNVLSDFRLATITPELLARKNEDLAAMGLPPQRTGTMLKPGTDHA